MSALDPTSVRRELARIGALAAQRGWVMATSGNFSAVISSAPLRLLVTPSGADKGALSPEALLEVDEHGAVVGPKATPSDEVPLHLGIVRRQGAGAVLHTHSRAATVLSRRHAAAQGLWLEDLEMLKALKGVRSHQHREWVPILDNLQDRPALARSLDQVLVEHPGAHGVLLRGHGLYAWGADLREALRHLEALEFMLDVRAQEA